MTNDNMQWDFLLNFFLFEETSYMGSKLPMEGYKMDLDMFRVTQRGSRFAFIQSSEQEIEALETFSGMANGWRNAEFQSSAARNDY